MSTEGDGGSEVRHGAPSRFIDDTTARLRVLARRFENLQTHRQGACQQACQRDDDGVCREHTDWLAEGLHTMERRADRELSAGLHDHDLWPWLSQRKGLAGSRVARVIARIGDPRRFPGQRCSKGHTLPPFYEPGTPCPVEAVPRAGLCVENEVVDGAGADLPDAGSGREGATHSGEGHSPGTADWPSDGEATCERCPGKMLEPRTTSGTRSLYHYAGLHVVDGRLPRRKRGTQCDWNPDLRELCIGPQGLADQIIMHRTQPYRDLYDATKERLTALEHPRAHRVARTRATKEFVKELLAAWKKCPAAEHGIDTRGSWWRAGHPLADPPRAA